MWDIGIKIFPKGVCICSLVNDEVNIADPLAKLRRRWESNIKMNLHGIGCGWGRGLDLSASGYAPIAGSCEIGIIPLRSTEFAKSLTSRETVSSSRRTAPWNYTI
jgi:hypothetical protein